MKSSPQDTEATNRESFPVRGRRCRIQHVTIADASRRREIESFYLSLRQELVFSRTRLDELWKAKVLLLAKVDGVPAGMIGIVRRFFGVPCTFIIVKAEYQNQGVGRMLYEARRPYCRRYGIILSIVLSGNQAGKNFFFSAGERNLLDDGQYAFFVSSQKRLVRWLFPLFRLVLPLLLTLWHVAVGRQRSR